MNRTEQIRLGCSKQENPRGSWVFLRFLFSAIHNHRIFCWADVGKNPEMPRFSWLLLGWISICRAPMLLCASYFLGSVRRSGRKGKYYAICLLLFQWNFSLSLALSLSLSSQLLALATSNRSTRSGQWTWKPSWALLTPIAPLSPMSIPWSSPTLIPCFSCWVSFSLARALSVRPAPLLRFLPAGLLPPVLSNQQTMAKK